MKEKPKYKYVKRTQKDYSMSFRLSVVDEVERESLQLFVKYSDVASACEALQWAANRAGKAKRQQGGERGYFPDCL